MVSHRTRQHSRKQQQLVTVNQRRPRFSVAIATRNYGHWLRRCLESVLSSYRKSGLPIEIVVVDDCSTDNTAKILDRYRGKYPDMFTIVRPATSGGISAAKNAAIRHCKGEYVALLDADDEFTSDKLAHCDEALRANPETELLTHDYTFINETTGETFVLGNEWYRSWRPPGVWVFRAGRVLFSEQMICGYEELEWSKRRWYEIRRLHIPEALTLVHGEETNDRWKIDRAVAGLDGMERWDLKKRKQYRHQVFACRVCGNQYFRSTICCRRNTERVPMVHYMAVSSFPYQSACDFSIVVFTNNDLSNTRSLCADLVKEFERTSFEMIFVRCHPERALLDYFCKLSEAVPVKAVFAPRDHSFVYGHDVNRAARTADGRHLILIDSTAKIDRGNFCASVQSAFRDEQVGIVSCSHSMQMKTVSKRQSNDDSPHALINYSCWSMRQDLFWQLGAMVEQFDKREIAVADLQRRAGKKDLKLRFAEPTNRLGAAAGTPRA